MTLHEWLIEAEQKHEDAPWIAAKTLSSTRTWIAANRGTVQLTIGQRLELDGLLARRLQDEPLAYILNSAPFYKRDFFVDQRVLIPRPETEDLINLALSSLRKQGSTDGMDSRFRGNDNTEAFVDIGTGSGAIAITLALETQKPVFASDISYEALDIAKQNAKNLHANVTFFQGPLLHSALVESVKNFSNITICANLPYLPDADKAVMPKSVTAYEPDLALFAGDDGNDLIKELLGQIKILPTVSCVILECDPPQAKRLLDFSKSLFPNADAEIIKDRCGRERFIVLNLRTPNRS
jgi:release factor glutamine methyltransferase